MKYTIGEFSRITSLTIKTLRLYHEKEILIPCEVDEFSKYRYYDEHNFERAESIKTLKRFDFTLAEIKEILSEFDDESDLLEQLKTKRNEIKSKISHYERISDSIDLIIKKEKETKMKNHISYAVVEKKIDSILIAGYRMKGKYNEAGKGFTTLAKKLGKRIIGNPMTLYYDGEYRENDADFETSFPVKNGIDSDEISVRELSGGKCISLIHKGSYNNLASTYKKLFEYLKKKQYKMLTPTREVYIKGPGMIFKGNPNNYLTEVQLFIEE
ncbi:MAG: MerR family transcriptional regulator [Melioribacteraceae bacterium]|nr:MerR family transcriptional regulator [Melioribacteraceae bacterium]MCF8264815.1 MerR family transcriptional regulator [Melioribacteraceae bacterium]MCF8430358.1 MerR family transcriptional regulator [Melioribacteraceae bacterium]